MINRTYAFLSKCTDLDAATDFSHVGAKASFCMQELKLCKPCKLCKLCTAIASKR